MPDWLEFHDSDLTQVTTTEGQIACVLDTYIHRWESGPGGWVGTGWMQQVRIVLSGAPAPPALPLLPEEIADGSLLLGEEDANGLVPVPFQASGKVRLWLQLGTADEIALSGTAVRIEAIADARYLEALPADFRPAELR
jgi:hypothetical protein